MANILSLCLSKRGEHFAPRPKFGNDKINIRLMFMANTETTNTAPIFYLQTKTETIYGLWAIMGLFRGCNWLKADQVQYGLECLFGWKVQKIQVRKNFGEYGFSLQSRRGSRKFEASSSYTIAEFQPVAASLGLQSMPFDFGRSSSNRKLWRLFDDSAQHELVFLF